MKPNLIIIGAMKSGTTSLHNYLRSHRAVSMSEPKELNFFSNPKFWKRGPAWYESHFQQATAIRGETSTSYTTYPRAADVARRMWEVVPEAKLIYLVRDPINRLVSHYVHALSEGLERRDFAEVVAAAGDGKPNPYVDQGRYFMQLSRFLPYFDKERILVLSSEGLRNRRTASLAAVATFLDIPDDFPEASTAREHNRGDAAMLARSWWGDLIYPAWLRTNPELPWKVKSPFFHLARLGGRMVEKPQPTKTEIATLTELFREDVQRLDEYTGTSFSEWRDYGQSRTATAVCEQSG